MYDRIVAVPRLLASVPEDGPGHPLLDAMRAALHTRYGAEVGAASLALYRDGRDSVAWHRDRPYKDLPESLVAVVSLGGGVRKFMLRPFGGGPSHAIRVGLGDLVVMGGTCQRSFEHCVPKTRAAEPRIAIMLRWPSSELRTND
jgi:alkylated DNA repair dioxygenase AlkB